MEENGILLYQDNIKVAVGIIKINIFVKLAYCRKGLRP